MKKLLPLLLTLFTLLSYAQVANPTMPLELCDDVSQDGTELFHLAVIDNQVLGTQSPVDFGITYHESQVDADSNINQLPTFYINVINPQSLFIRVEEITTGNYDTTTLELVVNPLPIVVAPNPQIVCNFDNDGYADFNLENSTLEVTGGQPDLSVTYYEVLVDAQSNVNPLSSPYSNIILNSQSIYVHVEDLTTGCFSIVSLELIVSLCQGIEVNAFFDINNDGIFNSDELRFTNGDFTYEVNNDSTITVVNTSTGNFTIPYVSDVNTYDITFSLDANSEMCYDVTTALFENVNVTSGNVVTVDFPVTIEAPCEDLAVYLIPNNSPRPGFNYYNTLILENISSGAIAPGSVEFVKEPLSTFVGVNNMPTGVTITTTATGFIADFTAIALGESRSLTIEMYIPPSISLGELLTNTATYTTATNDINSSNNQSSVSQIVIGSYDPNDILESHGPEIIYEDFVITSEYLYYTIRFQNVGTAEAINVRVENTVDALLDVSTLQLLKSSHDVVMTQNGSQLTWTFDDINLPAESQDADGSNGYVYFRIKPTAGYSIGTIIPNTAEIYFDFNAAVITNTFNTEFVEPALSVEEFSVDNTFLMHPNPADNLVNIALSTVLNEEASIIIYDIQGKRLMDKVLAKNTMELQLNVTHFQSGLYFVKLKTNTTETIKRLVVK